MKTLFSVIVPVYNVEEYLNQCVESILGQTFADFEAILVDDGSTDSCPAICDNYAKKDSRIKVIHKQNGGLVSARKAGALAASGEYIVCVDSDDYIASDYLLNFARAIKEFNADIVCCGTVWAFKDKKIKRPLSLKPGFYNRSDIESKIFNMLIERADGAYFAPTIWAKCIKKSLYLPKQLVVDDKIKIGEDHACLKPCVYLANSMVLLKNCSYYYRQNECSVTKNKKPFDLDGPRLIAQHFEKQIEMRQLDFQQQVYRFVVHLLFNAASTQFYSKRPYKKIRKEILSKIGEPYYQNAINKCKYSLTYWKGKLAQACLKYKLCALMKLYSCLR